ncbi:MAG: hypothetical protein IH586_01940 [Anaerolineaceae bacterium]|nr:hypothetical protein [Anaerolineaceae bacterium]
MLLFCSFLFPVIMILTCLTILIGLLVRYRIQVRRSKEAEFDWNLQLLAALAILAFLGLGAFLANLFIHFGSC